MPIFVVRKFNKSATDVAARYFVMETNLNSPLRFKTSFIAGITSLHLSKSCLIVEVTSNESSLSAPQYVIATVFILILRFSALVLFCRRPAVLNSLTSG